MLTLVLVVVAAALIFEYINGFHDTANSIATVVATKVLSPMQAVMLAASTNLVGALWGTAVAKTVASGIIDAGVVDVSSQLILCALLGADIVCVPTNWVPMPDQPFRYGCHSFLPALTLLERLGAESAGSLVLLPPGGPAPELGDQALFTEDFPSGVGGFEDAVGVGQEAVARIKSSFLS